MNSMCAECGVKQTTHGNGVVCKICGYPSFHLNEKRDDFCLPLSDCTAEYCNTSEKNTNECIKMDDSSPYATPFVSPSSSFKSLLTSYGSFMTSYGGDSLADLSSYSRVDSFDYERTELRDAMDHNYSSQGYLETAEHDDGTTVGDIYIESNDTKINEDAFRVTNIEKKLSSSSFASNDHVESNEDKTDLSDAMPDPMPKGGNDEPDEAEITSDLSSSLIANLGVDLFKPPEPESLEDDTESLAISNINEGDDDDDDDNDDDDDEGYSDGTKWVRSSSLSSLTEEPEINNSYRDEKQKAIVEAMNGQFKILVSRLLASEGVSFSVEEGDQSWLNIVASLSWEAAQLIKPEASEGRAMDPGSYVKVKCIATGSRHESQVIKGLVFKKNAAHKHMPTKFIRPKLLLLEGVLGQSAGSFSSFVSMGQERDDNLKSIIEMIDSCHPNIVLVEKTVSRDIQEALLSKGVTLVFDMKIHRLKRIARCIASPIISFSDIQGKPKLKHCQSFHIEKIVEEHNGLGEGGKKTSKTLMFLEGFRKPLGCTILLKGSHIEELKKIKCVIQYTVFAAYHLVLETSFFADQRVLSIYRNPVREGISNFQCNPLLMAGVSSPDYPITDLKDSKLSAPIANSLDIPIENTFSKLSSKEKFSVSQTSSRLLETNTDGNLTGENLTQRYFVLDSPNPDSVIQSESLAPGQTLLPQSTAATPSEMLKENSIGTPAPESGLSDSGLDNPTLVSQNIESQTSSELSDYEKINQGMAEHHEPLYVEQNKLGNLSEDVKDCIIDASERQDKDNIQSVLDPQSILILLSSQCVTKQTICEQSHLSRIKYYGNFDVTLGRYLKDILLNKKHRCSSCGEPPESHVYNYTHQNGNLTMLVKQVNDKLSGESEGKIWMWTRCLRCKRESGIPRPTNRVVLSDSACSLSFGKFLELSFSGHSAASRLSQCGHLLHRDCLRFFGLGSMIAMLKYSPVEIYAALKPPYMLRFNDPKGREWLEIEIPDVNARGNALFSEVSSLVQKLKLSLSDAVGQHITKDSDMQELYKFEEMLKQEKAEFEAAISKAPDSELIDIKWLYQELRFQLYVWDQRFCSLRQGNQNRKQKDGVSPDNSTDRNGTLVGDEKLGSFGHVSELSSSVGNDQSDTQTAIATEPTKSFEITIISSDKLDVDHAALECPTGDFPNRSVVEDATSSFNQDLESSASIKGIVERGQEAYSSTSDGMQIDHPMQNSQGAVLEKTNVEIILNALYSEKSENRRADEDVTSLLNRDQESSASVAGTVEKGQEEACTSKSDDMQGVYSIQNLKGEVFEKRNDVDPNTNGPSSEKVDKSMLNEQTKVSELLANVKLEPPKFLIKAPFSDLRKELRKDLHLGSLQKYDFINTYTPTFLPPLFLSSTYEMDWLHFPVGLGGLVLTASVSEISSIIACALAMSEDRQGLLNLNDKEAKEGKRILHRSTGSVSDYSVVSSNWSSIGSFESEGLNSIQSVSSFSSEDLASTYENPSSVDHLLSSKSLHPEIPLGTTKVAGKCKFSVVCIHAKEFYNLRRKCCPSELAYISSLSRCKKWDAQGGKSKAFFAKSLDNRLIIKQIKKAELDSFLKFASDYFKHVSGSMDSGSQTCLAKTLGIYQVHQYRSGKEIKFHVMVMENLLYGHDISRTYDLKGSVFSRYVLEGHDSEVFLDQNFVEDMRVSPIYIGGKTKHLLQRAIWNDTSFLTSVNVMDYSLLVGIDKQRNEIVFGIIDYLRQYTWDKQLETWVKTSIVVPKNELPTVISPKEYKKRFRKFMTKYFLTVPDTWNGDNCSACKCCNFDDNRSSAKVHCAVLPEQL